MLINFAISLDPEQDRWFGSILFGLWLSISYIRRRVEQTTKFVTGKLSDNSDMNTLFFDEGHTIFSLIKCFRYQNF